jgi:hypothetical protein
MINTRAINSVAEAARFTNTKQGLIDLTRFVHFGVPAAINAQSSLPYC